MGYEPNPDNGKWYKGEEELTGLMAAFADLTVDQMSDTAIVSQKIKEVKLADALGYTMVDGVWMDGDQPVTGIMRSLADKKIGEINGAVGSIKIGEIMGYEPNPDNGKWYNGEQELTGVMAAFADLTIDEMTNSTIVSGKIREVKLADALGYTNVDGVWMNGDTPVTGVIKIVADCPIGSVNEEINAALLGDILGYTKKSDGWYDGDKKLSAFVCKVSDSRLNELNTTLDDLCLGDIIDADDLDSGFLKLAQPDWKISELGSNMNNVFATTTMGDYYENGIITFGDDGSTANTLDALAPEWRNKNISEFVPYLIKQLTSPFS